MTLFELLRADGSIVVNKKLAHAIGLDAAVMYSELLSKHYYFEARQMLDETGAFFNTVEDMNDDTTLNSRSQRLAINTLTECGLIEYEVKGMPRKRFFRIVFDESLLRQLLGKPATCSEEIEEQVVRNCSLNNNQSTIQRNNTNQSKNMADAPRQSTLVSVPEQIKSSSSRSTRRDKSLEKMSHAIRTGVFVDLKPTDFVYYFEQQHNAKMPESIAVPTDRKAGYVVGTFRDNFINRYDLELQDVCRYIDAFIDEYKGNPQIDTKYVNRIDWDTFNHTWLLDKLMPAVIRKCNPIERRFKTHSNEVVTRSIDENEVF